MLLLQPFDPYFYFKPHNSISKTKLTKNAIAATATEQDVHKQVEHITPAVFYHNEKFYFVDCLFVIKHNNGYRIEVYSKPWGTCPRVCMKGDLWYVSINFIPYTTPHGRIFYDFDEAIRYYYDFYPENMSIVPKIDHKLVSIEMIQHSQTRLENNVDNAIHNLTYLITQVVRLAIVIIVLLAIF